MRDGGFEDWTVVRGIWEVPASELKVLCCLRVKGSATMKELTSRGIETAAVLAAVKSGRVSEFPTGTFNLLPFWKATDVTFETDEAAKTQQDRPYSLFDAWRRTFGVDVPTQSLRTQMLAQAKRMLKSRDLQYWRSIMDAAVKDDFWRDSCRNGITTLEKAALKFGSGTAAGGRFEKVFGAK